MHIEENSLGIFPMDGDDVEVVPYVLPDEETDTDDEVMNKHHLSTQQLKPKDSQLGTSLPILIPVYRPVHGCSRVQEVSDDVGSPVSSNDGDHGHCVDVAASIQALARSIQAADDPERLFGELPQRRRCTIDEANLPQRFHAVGLQSHIGI
ncbi:unnamed protein product [Soboliphyme baturini]|uniref:Uncharacterized protein n=1 Tax=Soboliphyme baturini TaxID=241478 RepID=A0A183IAU8_9BILA|nr:unnamed protein product [Soboliphyme baturini]